MGFKKINKIKTKISNYQPLKGFLDLRNFDISNKDFLKLWRIQRYLFQCEENRQKGFYKNMSTEFEKVKDLSAEYQQTIFEFKYKIL